MIKLWKNYFAIRKRSNIKQSKESVIKMEHYRISKLLNDSIASKF